MFETIRHSSLYSSVSLPRVSPPMNTVPVECRRHFPTFGQSEIEKTCAPKHYLRDGVDGITEGSNAIQYRRSTADCAVP